MDRVGSFRIFFLAVFVLLLSSCGGTPHNADKVNIRHHGGSKPVQAKLTSANMVTVSKGDTVYAISKRHHLSTRAIIDINHLRPPYALSVGQKLHLPKQNFYIVKKGDTIYSISRTFSLSQAQIVSLNKLTTPYTLSVGQKLYISTIPQQNQRAGGNYRVISPVSSGQKQIVTTPKSAQKLPIATSPVQRNIAVRPAPKPLYKPAARAGGKFSWPVRGKIVSAYGAKSGGLHNDGINIAAPLGSPVRAAENGVVAYAGNELKGFGNLLLVKHGDGYMTAYAHLDKISIGKGAAVKKGQSIATVGTSGGKKTPQLHFELRRGKKPINPSQFLGG